MTNRQLVASQKIKEKYSPRRYQVLDVVSGWRLLDVIPEEQTIYHPDLELQLLYKVKCISCGRYDVSSISGLPKLRPCLHTVPTHSRITAEFEKLYGKSPSDNEILFYTKERRRLRAEAMTEKEMRAIIHKNRVPEKAKFPNREWNKPPEK